MKKLKISLGTLMMLPELTGTGLLLYNLVKDYKRIADMNLTKTKYAKPYREAKQYLELKGVVFKPKEALQPCLTPFTTYIEPRKK